MELKEALRRISEQVTAVTEKRVLPLTECFGSILAEDIVAKAPVPAFAKSAMDGYACRAKDIAEAGQEHPVKLRVLGEILAGDRKEIVCMPMSTVRIMTGAGVPEGYDTVIRQEDTDLGESEVRIFRSAGTGVNVCPVGEEVKEGETVLRAGTRIGRTAIGLLAALGYAEVTVLRPVRAAVISTGSELVPPGEELVPGKIYGTIRYMIAAALRRDGLEVSYEADCEDDPDTIAEHIKKAAEAADLLITTGGVSVGKKDLLPEVLHKLGAETLFSGVRIQPGTPTIASIFCNKVILSLSGNPYAALANFDLYYPALLDRLTGCRNAQSNEREAVMMQPYEKKNHLRRLVRAYEEGGKVYLPVSGHKSSVFGNMESCNCYIDVPAETTLSVGDTVKIRKMWAG